MRRLPELEPTNGRVQQFLGLTGIPRIHQKSDAIVDQVREETSRVIHQIARREEILVDLLACAGEVYTRVRSQLLFDVLVVQPDRHPLRLSVAYGTIFVGRSVA